MKDKKKRFSWKLFILFVFYQVFFIAVSAPFLVYYGPFDNLKKVIVGTAMSTMKHQYIATWFLSDEQIKEILGKTSSKSYLTANEDLSAVKISYKDDKQIERYDIHTAKFDAYLLEIKDPTRIKVGYTSKLGVQGQTTSQIARNNGGVAAINGGTFADNSKSGDIHAGTGAFPGGIVISGGKLIYSDVKEDTKLSVVAFTKYGVLIVGDKSIRDLKDLEVTEALSFRPPTLIVNGEGQIKKDDVHGLDPRTAIGQKQDGTILMLVVDGRKGFKLGASLYDVQQILLQHGAWNAGNLDGGSSSTMYLNGQVINSPSDWDGERTIATALYVK